ncbi:MAG: GNAT family N-acetyltransferase [Verrucomicrobia bacterium]|nr:GNAT family N-acetyltransferase [Verrucomicrobiota bacterium]
MPECQQKEQVVTLKSLTSENIDDFMEWATDDEVTKYMMWNSYTTRSEAESFFVNVVEKHPWFKAICVGEKVVGSITLDKGKGAHSCKAELGYVVARKYWGRGLTTKAINLAIQTGFKDLNIQRIEAYVDPTNIGSQRVLEKNGLIREGFLRNSVVQKGLVKDRWIFAIVRN